MTIDKGLRSFFPGVRTPDEIKEQEDARAAIRAKLNKLQAANLDSEDLPPINVEVNLPAKTKKKGFSQKEFENYIATRPSAKESKGAWAKFKSDNAIAVKKDQELKRIEQKKKLFNHHKLENSKILLNNINLKKWDAPKKLDGFQGPLVVDPKHPDGIKLTNEHDMYDLYKDDPVRYLEEVKYLFEKDSNPPTDRIRKKQKF